MTAYIRHRFIVRRTLGDGSLCDIEQEYAEPVRVPWWVWVQAMLLRFRVVEMRED
jgi:hypothetical protein